MRWESSAFFFSTPFTFVKINGTIWALKAKEGDEIMALKMIPLSWKMMTSTLEFPVLVKGKIISMTAFEKGEGQWSGRFPYAFAVCTPDTEIETIHCHRGTEATKDPRRIWVKNSKPVMFRWADKAREVALAWASK